MIAAAARSLVEIVVVIGAEGGRPALRRAPTIERAFGSPREIGELFLTDHLLAFEITSIVLLVAAVGGVDPRRARAPDDEEEADADARARTSPGTSSSRRSSSRSARSACCIRRSPLIVLLSLEIMLNGANLALIAFSRQLRARATGRSSRSP